MKIKKIISAIAITAVASAALSGCFRARTPSSGPITLTFYGLDNSDVFDPIINAYKSQNSDVTIRYKKFADISEYESLLVNEMAEGEGPDIFYVHNTWLPKHTKKLVGLQSDSLTPEKFSEIFVDVATQDFVQPDPNDGVRKIYALPLYVDTLALYYNKRDFERKLPERGKPAPAWDVIKQDADKFREQDSSGGALTHGEIALGRADNIKLAADILYNLFLQAGIDFYDGAFKRVEFASKGQEVFDYFLSFAAPQNKNYSWSADLVPAGSAIGEVEAFLSGKVSAILGYSDLYPKLETDLRNVNARFRSVISLSDVAVAPVPQIATDAADYKVWADYNGLAVSRNSKNAQEAWNFVQFAASKENARAFHQKTKRPAARRDLIEEQKKEPITDVFVSQVGFAGSYRIFSDKLFADFLKKAVDKAIEGMNSREALNEAQTLMNDIMQIEAPNGLYPPIKKKS